MNKHSHSLQNRSKNKLVRENPVTRDAERKRCVKENVAE